jgi:hypothetical protein
MDLTVWMILAAGRDAAVWPFGSDDRDEGPCLPGVPAASVSGLASGLEWMGD